MTREGERERVSKQVDGMRVELGEWWVTIGRGRTGLGGVGR
jgi:hypothetical protein